MSLSEGVKTLSPQLSRVAEEIAGAIERDFGL